MNCEIDDIGFSEIILSERIDKILDGILTKDEYKEISMYKKNIDNNSSYYLLSDLNNFFLVSLNNDFYSSIKLDMDYNKKRIIRNLIQYRRNCKEISDKVGLIEFTNVLKKNIKMSLFDFAETYSIPFYDLYSMYLKYGKNLNIIFTKKDNENLLKNNMELFMKIFDVGYAINNFTNILSNCDSILCLKNRGQFFLMSDGLLEFYSTIHTDKKLNEIQIDKNNIDKLFSSFKDYLSLFVLLDDKELIEKTIMTTEEEEYIRKLGNSIFFEDKLYLSDINEIYKLSKCKYPSKKFNTELIDAIINEKYDFIQNNNSKIIDFKRAIKK